MRLDAYLAGKSDIRSRSEAKRLIDAGVVMLNGAPCTKASQDVSNLDDIRYTLPSPPPVPEDSDTGIDLPVLYEDDACMVVQKPAGLIVHPGSGTKPGAITLLDVLKSLFRERSLPFSASSVLVHRLDKDTTGCLLIAKTPEAHTLLQTQFADRSTKKEYIALVFGAPSPASATIDIPIGRDSAARTKMSVHRATGSRAATTTYSTLGKASGTALLLCDLHTGRTHQIRVHLAAIKHPVLGDLTYGHPDATVKARGLGITSVFLHAYTLSFDSPATKKRVHVTAPLPSEKQAILDELGLRVTD